LQIIKNITALWLLLAVSFSLAAQNDTLFWYQNGVPEKWLSQHDVFLFRSFNSDEIHLEADTNTVLFQYSRNNKPDKLQVVYFHPYSTLSQREHWKQQVTVHPLFGGDFPAITQNNELQSTEGNWLATDDIIAVQFHSNFYFDERYSDFTGLYGLTLLNEEVVSASPQQNPVFIFKWNMNTDLAQNTIHLCQTMYEQDSSMVKNAVPNKIVAFMPMPETVTSVANQSETADFYVSFIDSRLLKAVLNIDNSENHSLQIMTSLGQQVLVSDMSGAEQYVSLHDYPAGIYYAVLINGNNTLHGVKKFLLR
jgi:hypothetical protein